jgi:hypothetical protein
MPGFWLIFGPRICISAKDLEHIGGTPDETEEFEIILQTPADIEEQIRTGVIWDGMTIAGWSIAKGRM